ncbi:DsbC family protein [Hydrogenothermus marinus]|uniref:Thiol:disulfide interchange protein DsbC n=1 Tax=Hydrogenothermus marinus TaxID=133270 RepID=A0A3M0C4I1_9AQUI|nr:DsbC family protein [Hydrogenothermus marinus]RMA97842.1 thiol:disulfide interchange protein DsbC [Hydrogenothermus marinus]
MKVLKLFSIVLALSLISISVKAQESCLSNSDVSIKDVKKALAPLLGNAKVLSVSDSPVDGLYEVIVEVNGKKIPVYLDCSMEYLISGEIISIKERKSLTREKVTKLNQQDLKEKLAKLEKRIGKEKAEKLKKILGERGLSRIRLIDENAMPTKADVILGNKNAKFVIYEITDPQCPFCKRFHEEMKKVLAKRNDVQFRVILFPLPFHKYAKPVSKAIICQPTKEASAKLLNKAFEKQTDKEEFKKLGEKACDKAEEALNQNMEIAQKLGIRGTPTLIFPHGIVISGAIPADMLNKIIDALK